MATTWLHGLTMTARGTKPTARGIDHMSVAIIVLALVFGLGSAARSVLDDLKHEDIVRQRNAQEHKDILAMERGVKRLRGEF